MCLCVEEYEPGVPKVSDQETKSKKEKPLKYVLLAGIYILPRSGYDLTKWLQIVGQHCWSVEHSSVYPALRQLEDMGLIESERLAGVKGPDRSIYTITTAGKDALTAWVAQSSPRPAIKDEQVLRVLCFDLLPRDTALEQIRAVRSGHLAHLDFFKTRLALIDEKQTGPRLIMRRGILAEESYIAWCDEVVETLLRRPDEWKSEV